MLFPNIMVNIGHNNVVPSGQVIAIISPNSAPAKRIREEAKAEGRLIDASQGHRTRSIIVTNSNHVILAALEAKTLTARFNAVASAQAEKLAQAITGAKKIDEA
jgi:regulator of extracellular matrix RemA (YlzA/DUF370 family)